MCLECLDFLNDGFSANGGKLVLSKSKCKRATKQSELVCECKDCTRPGPKTGNSKCRGCCYRLCMLCQVVESERELSALVDLAIF